MNTKIHLSAFAVVLATSLCAVRHGEATAPPGRWTPLNGTVFDNETHLTWLAASGGQMHWNAASTYCATLNMKGTGWRLPSAKELQSIIDEKTGLDKTVFSGPAGHYWSITPYSYNVASIWVVQMNGLMTPFPKSTAFEVRCVR